MAGPPHVVHLQRRPSPGQFSIEKVFEAVRRHLPGYDVEVVVSAQPNTGVLPRLRAVLQARRRQGEVTHVVGDVHFLTVLLRRRTTVLTIHDLEFLTRIGTPAVKKAVYAWLWVRLPVRRSSTVTVCSEQTRDDVLALVGGDPARLHVIPDPVREHFVPAPAADNPRPVVLLMGTWPSKNLPRSAQALAGLDCHVVLTGPLTAEQQQQLAGLDVDNRTDLTDDQVLAALHECDLLLFPSLHEGFGLPIIEAQACGRPVVTSDRRPMRDVAGGAACLVDPEDVTSIRAGVLRVLQDIAYREQLVAAGLRNVERFTAASVAAAYAAVYDEVLSRR
jgi:glycosyltransferase involved in cell wall biosynthesis